MTTGRMQHGNSCVCSSGAYGLHCCVEQGLLHCIAYQPSQPTRNFNGVWLLFVPASRGTVLRQAHLVLADSTSICTARQRTKMQKWRCRSRSSAMPGSQQQCRRSLYLTNAANVDSNACMVLLQRLRHMNKHRHLHGTTACVSNSIDLQLSRRFKSKGVSETPESSD